MALPNTTPMNEGQNALDAVKLRETQAEAKKTPKQRCQENGGFWDEKTQTCLMMPPTPKTETATQPKTELPQNTVFTNADTGKLTGIRTPSGQNLLNLSPAEVRALAAKYNQQTRIPEGFMSAEQGAQQQIEQQQAQQALSQIGLTPQEIAAAQGSALEAPIDVGQALTAGTVRNVPSLLTNIGAGAAAGAGIGAIPALATAGLSVPVGAVIGGIVGAIKSIWGGVQSNIAQQQKGEIGAAQDVLRDAKTNMRQLATLASKDPVNAADYVQAYNTQLALVYQARAKIKLETQGDLNKFMEDGTDILSDFDLFLMPNGAADIYSRKLALSLASGTPLEFTTEDLATI